MRKFIAALGGMLLVAGCGYPPTEIKSVETKTPIEIPEGADLKPFMLSRVLFHIPAGQDLGRRLGGGNCRAVRSRINWGIDMPSFSERDYIATFVRTMKAGNYPVTGDPEALFDDDSQSRAELKVAAEIEKLQFEPCYNKDDQRDFNYGSGTAAIRVRWAVYDIFAKRVIYKVTTEGFFHTEESRTNGAGVVLGTAFWAAITNLQADPGFNAALMRHRASAQPLPPEQTAIQVQAGVQTPATIPDAQRAVISIKNATSLGSGFIISPDGYALTNQHVVGEARIVTVRLASGRELTADVLRADAGRDVALIKLGESNLPTLKLRLNSRPEAGDELYAIGTPLEIGLAQTVTHGVVSGYRESEGFTFIQADVGIHHGNSGGPLLDRSMNVVGLTDVGVHNEEATPIFLFIPIAEALRYLNIQMAQPEQSGHMQ